MGYPYEHLGQLVTQLTTTQRAGDWKTYMQWPDSASFSACLKEHNQARSSTGELLRQKI